MNLFKTYLGMLLGIFFIAQLQAQQSGNTPSGTHQRWEIGLQAGVAQGQTDLNNFGQYEINPSGGLLVRYHIDDNFALRTNIVYAEITGDDKNFSNRIARGFNFSAPLTEGSIVFEVDLLGKRRWKNDGTFRRIVSPYLFGGGGYAFSTPSTFYNESANPSIRDQIAADKSNVRDGHLILPFGVGLKVDLNENWVFGVETGLRAIFNDYLDGVSQTGNSRKNDTYALGMVQVSYRIPFTADRDRDGVADNEDPCPDEKGSEKTKGCPDTDGDGVTDNIDACPSEKGNKTTQGCPDRDQDGISDKSDPCPDEKGSLATGGCPDQDRDGVSDKSDACPDVAGLAKFQGCPDTDGDGIADKDDRCPEQRGTAENGGCPMNDRDRDGVLDEQDKCPDIAGLARFLGCADTDADEVADPSDACPTEAGTLANNGCPALKEADAQILKDAIYGVQFERAKSVIKTTSYTILDKVADVMSRYPAYNLVITGHTDSDGNDESNRRLSEARAKACYDYLQNKGITAARMKYTGMGEARPVAENTTPEGKQKNRRVVFDLTTAK